MATRTFRFSVTAPNLEAPSWFTAQTPGQWFAVPNVSASAGGSATFLAGGGNIKAINAYNGACVDNTRGEVLLPANGGHGDYKGNEVWALRLMASTPQWYRLTQPTPDAYLQTASVFGTAEAKYSDGRMRSVHSWNKPLFIEDRIWYVSQPAYYGIGESTSAIWSFNRNYPGVPQNPGNPGEPELAWTNDAGPWKFHKLQLSGVTTARAACAWDSTRRVVWDLSQAGTFSEWRSVSTDYLLANDGTINRYPSTYTEGVTRYTKTGQPNVANSNAWACLCGDYLVAPSVSAVYPSRVYVMDVRAPGNGFSERTTNSVTWLPGWTAGVMQAEKFGAVYQNVPGNRAVLIYDVDNGRDLWKLSVPEDPSSLSGWNWTEIAVSGATPTKVTDYTGTNSKFNIVDMGGESALVVVPNGTDVYMLRFPSGGF